MSDYSVTKPKGPYPTDLPEVKVGPNEETIETYGEDAIVSLDIVERLNENIIADAFERRAIVDGALCERLIRERKEAAETIKKLRAAVTAERERCYLAAVSTTCNVEETADYYSGYCDGVQDAAAALKEEGDEKL